MIIEQPRRFLTSGSILLVTAVTFPGDILKAEGYFEFKASLRAVKYAIEAIEKKYG